MKIIFNQTGGKRFLSFLIITITMFLPFSCATDNRSEEMVLTSEFIYEEAPFPSCHASTIAETPEGLIAAWFGGTHEKHEDVEIWISRKERAGWTEPVSVADGVQDANKRYPHGILYFSRCPAAP
jgi:hypothetical protein